MNRKKGKLLALLEIFSTESDEGHPLSVKDLTEKLSAYGITAERKSIYDDIETLCDYGYDIVSVKSKTTGYYLASRRYELSELKLLVDAVECARFITRKKSDELIGKLANELSQGDARHLSRQVHNRGRVKTMNESVYYNIDFLHTAISSDKSVRFHYFQWNEKKEKVLRRDGAFYFVSPIALLWDDENYYLVAFDHEKKDIRHFRVDKMLNISIEESRREGKELYEGFDPATYASAVFGMYGGRKESVTLRAKNELAGVVIDRFGRELTLFPDKEGHFLFHLRVAVSPNFLSWVMGFGGDMQVLSPESVKSEIKALAERVLLSYR